MANNCCLDLDVNETYELKVQPPSYEIQVLKDIISGTREVVTADEYVILINGKEVPGPDVFVVEPWKKSNGWLFRMHLASSGQISFPEMG